LRDAVRGVVLDPDDRVLLVRFELPHRVGWETPGGGVDHGESDEVAIRRELLEESGLEELELGPLVWTRTHVFGFGGGWDGQVERYFLVRTARFEPAPRLSREQLRAEYVTGVRWWELDELDAAPEEFAPRSLPSLVRDLVENGPPSEPLDVGV
jgi:ADP-ribose pyrophosphatase YjhB (NUDIX family)